MIGIKINENVIPTKVEVAKTRESLEITFEEVKEKTLNFFEQSLQSGIQEVSSGGTTIRIWAFKVPTFKRTDGSEMSDEEKLKRINEDMQEKKNQLTHILQRYITGQIVFDRQYEGTGVDTTNWAQMWLDNNVLRDIFNNIANQFIELITPYIGDKELKSRLKLIRQSADKPYPTFPGGRYVGDVPFYEPMEVPANASKIKFTKYEIDKGLANNEVPDKDKEADQVPEATPEVSTSVFGHR